MSESVHPFVYEQLAQRVLFGPGRRHSVDAEVDRLGARRVLLVAGGSSKPAGDDLAAALGDRLAVRWSEVAQHVPIELADRARDAAAEAGADAVVCIGGGSATGLAKAVALTARVPIVAIPTTYAGSEQTPIYGLTSDNHKQTGTDPIVLPRVVVYDVELTMELSAAVTGASAFNALAHAVEALYVPGHNPVTTALALDAVRAIHGSLPAAIADGSDLDARGGLLYGAYLAGMALGATGAGLHHKLAHLLGGMFGLVHADVHSVLLPHVVAFNAPALPAEMARLAAALGVSGADAAGALWDLAAATGVPTSLAHLGLGTGDLGAVAQRAAGEVTANPRRITAADIHDLLDRAADGHRPRLRAVHPPQEQGGTP